MNDAKAQDIPRSHTNGGTQDQAKEPVQEEPPSVAPSYGPPPVSAKTFTIDELERATDGFAAHNFVGEGGFGRVYRGVLESTGEVCLLSGSFSL